MPAPVGSPKSRIVAALLTKHYDFAVEATGVRAEIGFNRAPGGAATEVHHDDLIDFAHEL
jgi:hypothetical protein